MNLKNTILLLLAVFIVNGITAQNQKNQLKITGKVKNFNNKPIANAIIYLDSVKTEVTTNKRGLYKIKLLSKVQYIGAFTDKYGLLSTTFTGEQKINFVYRDPKDVASGDDMKIGMVYKQDIVKPKSSINRGSNYEDFSSVAQLLNARFPFVQVNGGQIKIGKGPNTFSGDSTPLIIIDNVRSNVQAFITLSTTDIEHIKVVRRGSEAAEYGSLGASNGVIIVKLKIASEN
jgi:hypothetical protein